MRCLLLLAAVCCLVLSACGSPIARPEDNREVEVGRQAAAAPAAPAATDDDDDDDDDDDEGDDIPGFGDDDDDEEEDDDEADDEDEDDYDLPSFFDGLLGEDDDDDDDDVSAATPSPVVAPVEPAPAPAAVAAVEESEVASSEAEGDIAEASETEGDEPEAGQKEPASAEVESSPAEPAPTSDDDEDDDDEDDALDALAPEDDDDEEDEDEDEDDDDDDLSIGRNNSEKHARSLAEPTKKQAAVPAIYIVKYNKFVDTILDKMNDILRQSYDPVSVKLQPIDANKKTSKPKKNKKSKGKKKSSNKKKNSARGEVKVSTTTPETPAALMEENPLVNEVKTDALVESTQIESRAIKEKENAKAKPIATSTRTTKKPPTKTQKPKTKPPVKTTTKKPTKNKTKAQKSKPRAKGTLYGLSSLRRMGDVAVNIMSDHTTVKSNFAVGPLILKVEKVVGRGVKKEVKSATATTAEMTGKLSLRINNEGVATLHSIKVLQPKQVRVDSNHERTRELVWKRSSRIAHVVTEKLFTASKPMFHYQPVVML